MASHFECLGFPLRPADAEGDRLLDLVRGVFDGGTPAPAPGGFHAATWDSPEGVSLFAAVAAEEAGEILSLRCLSPSFRGSARARAKLFRTVPDPACPFCDFLHGEVLRADGAPGEPFFAEIRDPAFARDLDLRGAEAVVGLVLLAQSVRPFRDREEFLARRPAGVAAGSFAATGLLAAPHRARARAAGTVRAPRILGNPLGGGRFWHARLQADAAELDVLAAEGDLPGGLVDGTVLLAEGSLVARFPEGVPG
jgi:hypothetical protein